jgi:hypothetical protein
MTKEQITIRRPSGQEEFMLIYLAADELWYCSYCEEASPSEDWSTEEYFNTESLSEALPAEDSDRLLQILRDHCPVYTQVTCGSCNAVFDSAEGDSWWTIDEDQFICTNDNEWYSQPHEALSCCGNCFLDRSEHSACYCADMVDTNPDGTPSLIHGLPLAICHCGGNRCNRVVCLVCHQNWVREGDRAQLVEALVHAKEHLAFYEVSYESGTPTEQTQRIAPECPICGTYCCAVHKTHAAKHAMCWEKV